MIINIRGTSGSGKSTLTRRVMQNSAYGPKTSFRVEGRKQPIGYVLPNKFGGRSLAILGHYETACGGCDTISKMDDIFQLVRDSHAAGHDVIFEGLLISADVNRTQALHDEDLPLVVVGLDKVPLEECLYSVNKRRAHSDDERIKKVAALNEELSKKGRKLKPLPERRGLVNPKNTESKFKGVQQSMKRLVDAGVEVHSCGRDEAYSTICAAFGLVEEQAQ